MYVRLCYIMSGIININLCFSLYFQLDGATYHSKLQSSGGGVGRNIADGLSKIHGSVHLISLLGNDQVKCIHNYVALHRIFISIDK